MGKAKNDKSVCHGAISLCSLLVDICTLRPDMLFIHTTAKRETRPESRKMLWRKIICIVEAITRFKTLRTDG